MTNKRWDGSVFVDLTTKKRWTGSAWVDLTVSKRWDGSVWVDFFAGGAGALSATADRGSVSKFEIDPEPAPPFKTLGTATVTITATGGTAPYTYSWARVSGDSAIAATQPALAATAFQATIAKGSSLSATWRCTITDAALATDTVNVSVTFDYGNNT